MSAAHEDLARERPIEGSSERSFGLVFAAAFLVIAGWPLHYGAMPRWWALGAAALFALAALATPGLLAPLNRWWLRLGVALGRLASPLALALLFFAVFAPIGALMRLCGKDPLRLRRDPRARSHWIARRPPGPPPDSMTHPF
jgi:hypothetical protein